MTTYNFDDMNQAEIIRANQLMEEGRNLIQNGQYETALHLILDAVEIYLETGSYLKIAPAFNYLVSSIRTQAQIMPIMDRINQTIESMEYLNLDEEIAKLKLALANLAYKSRDYLTAGNLFIEIADLFHNVDPDEYRQASGMFLLRAGECFEKIFKTERGEDLVYQAIRRFDTSIFNYPEAVEDLRELILNNNLEEAIEKIREIASFFRNLEEELERAPEFNESFRNLKNNVNARLIHMVSEYNLLKMMCYKYLKLEEKVLEQAQKSIKDLRKAIQLTKAEIKTGNYSSADLHRLTFDIFLLQVFQEFAHYQVEDPLDLALRGLSQKIKKIILKMQFYEYTTHILEFDLRQSEEIFEDMILSQILDPYRRFIQKSLHL